MEQSVNHPLGLPDAFRPTDMEQVGNHAFVVVVGLHKESVDRGFPLRLATGELNRVANDQAAPIDRIGFTLPVLGLEEVGEACLHLAQAGSLIDIKAAASASMENRANHVLLLVN